MYTFQQQQKIFKDLLTNNPSNKQCADCSTIGPTWASLNFGVFLCSNCSGAHRALGPTITRVKSTKLDQWQKDWMECMQIGNKELNEYWQADLGMIKKPRMGAAQPELMKYASQKYVKKRYLKNASEQDPLTRYRNGKWVRNTQKEQTKSVDTKPVTKKTMQVPRIQKPAQVRSNVAVENEAKNLNLIEFQFPQSPKLQMQSQTSQVNRNTNNTNHVHVLTSVPTNQRQSSENNNPLYPDDDDEFSEFTEHGTSCTGTTNENNLTYEQLIAKKSGDSRDSRVNVPTSLHHTQSASSIPHHSSPHFNINMNGHTHHVGGINQHQTNGQYGNTLNFKQLYNQPVQQQNPYQSVGYLPVNPPIIYNQPQQQYNSLYPMASNQFVVQSVQQNSMAGQQQNYGLNQYAQQNSSQYNTNNNFSSSSASLNPMSTPPNQQTFMNPSHQSLGGYHNQGYGSHAGQQQPQQPPSQKQQEFKWNDFTGWQGMGVHHQQSGQSGQQNQQEEQQQQQGKSWIDDWK